MLPATSRQEMPQVLEADRQPPQIPRHADFSNPQSRRMPAASGTSNGSSGVRRCPGAMEPWPRSSCAVHGAGLTRPDESIGVAVRRPRGRRFAIGATAEGLATAEVLVPIDDGFDRAKGVLPSLAPGSSPTSRSPRSPPLATAASIRPEEPGDGSRPEIRSIDPPSQVGVIPDEPTEWSRIPPVSRACPGRRPHPGRRAGRGGLRHAGAACRGEDRLQPRHPADPVGEVLRLPRARTRSNARPTCASTSSTRRSRTRSSSSASPRRASSSPGSTARTRTRSCPRPTRTSRSPRRRRNSSGAGSPRGPSSRGTGRTRCRSSPQVAADANPIDDLVKKRLATLGAGLSPEADRRTLARRLYFDLLGLPPKPEEVAAFVEDHVARRL